MSLLVALALAAAPGCPDALAAAAVLDDPALAARAAALARGLEDAGAGPTAGLAAAAGRLADAAAGTAQQGAAAAFRGALASHCAFAVAPASPEASAADRAALAEVLARPELSRARLDPGAIRRALVRFWDWLVELLGTQEAERYASLGRALFLGAAAAALALAAAALRRRRRGVRGDRAFMEEAGAAAEAVPDVAAGRAEEALRRGDARDALRLALLAALGALERAGHVPRGRALTNEELVALVEGTREPPHRRPVTPRPHRDQDQDQDQDQVEVGKPSPASDLALLARAFDRAVYGGLPVTVADARDAVERARRLVLAAGATP